MKTTLVILLSFATALMAITDREQALVDRVMNKILSKAASASTDPKNNGTQAVDDLNHVSLSEIAQKSSNETQANDISRSSIGESKSSSTAAASGQQIAAEEEAQQNIAKAAAQPSASKNAEETPANDAPAKTNNAAAAAAQAQPKKDDVKDANVAKEKPEEKSQKKSSEQKKQSIDKTNSKANKKHDHAANASKKSDGNAGKAKQSRQPQHKQTRAAKKAEKKIARQKLRTELAARQEKLLSEYETLGAAIKSHNSAIKESSVAQLRLMRLMNRNQHAFNKNPKLLKKIAKA